MAKKETVKPEKTASRQRASKPKEEADDKATGGVKCRLCKRTTIFCLEKRQFRPMVAADLAEDLCRHCRDIKKKEARKAEDENDISPAVCGSCGESMEMTFKELREFRAEHGEDAVPCHEDCE